MISRRTFLSAASAVLPAVAKQKFSERMGLELYSLRREARRDLPATLAMARKFGFKELEVGDLFGRSAAEFRRLTDADSLKITSMMAPYDRLEKEVDSVAADARALGAEYVVCSTIPHKKEFTAEDCHRAAGNLNRWGESLLKSGLHCCYHTHGIEFGKSPDGTLFDTLARLTNPKFFNFEMDIFWIVFAFQDPVKMLERYRGRFPLMHVKDMRKDTVRGGSPGPVKESASVVLGTGLLDLPAIFRAAEKTGVRHYYLEDEAVDAAQQIPKSLRYLDTLNF